MAETSIQWCDYSWNPWSGCTKVSPGCAHCYAEVNYSVLMRGVKWGPNGTRVLASDHMWTTPRKWNRLAREAGVRHRVFCASLADVFEDWDDRFVDHKGNKLWECANCEFIAPYDCMKTLSAQGLDAACKCSRGPEFVPIGMNSVRKRLFALIDATPNLDWLILTKRPENIRRMWADHNVPMGPQEYRRCLAGNSDTRHRHNVWLGTSVETQNLANKRVPELLKCRDLAPVLFLSCEPLLALLDLRSACTLACPNDRKCVLDSWTGHRIIQDSTEGGIWVECACSRLGGIDWVIVGGESGPKAREFNVDWGKSIIDQCSTAGVACFVKQLGSRPTSFPRCPIDCQCGLHYGFKDKKGGDPDEWPERLRVRQWPKVEATA